MHRLGWRASGSPWRALDTLPGLGERVPGQGPPRVGLWGPPCREEKHSKGKREARAIPRSPGSTAEGTSGSWTGWRNLRDLEGGRRKPKAGLGFPLPLPPPPPRYLSKSVSSSPPLSGQSLLRHSPAPKDRPEKSSWRSGGPSQGQSSPQRSHCHSSCLLCGREFSVLCPSRTDSTGGVPALCLVFAPLNNFTCCNYNVKCCRFSEE